MARGDFLGFDADGNEIREAPSAAPVDVPEVQGETLDPGMDQALADLEAGVLAAIEASDVAGQLANENLQPFTDTTAFNEQAALLGAFGPEAQAAAIADIPVSEARSEQDIVQRRGLLRQASVLGRRGSGATAGSLADLGSAQEATRVSDRIGALAPIADISLGAASTISGLEEARLTREAQLQAGLGQQQSQILLGQAAGVVEAGSAAAQAAALAGQSQGQITGDLVGQAGQLAGNLLGQQGVGGAGVNPLITDTNPLGLAPGQGL